MLMARPRKMLPMMKRILDFSSPPCFTLSRPLNFALVGDGFCLGPSSQGCIDIFFLCSVYSELIRRVITLYLVCVYDISRVRMLCFTTYLCVSCHCYVLVSCIERFVVFINLEVPTFKGLQGLCHCLSRGGWLAERGLIVHPSLNP